MRSPRLDEILVEEVLLDLQIFIRKITYVLGHLSGVCRMLLFDVLFIIRSRRQQTGDPGPEPVGIVMARLYRIFLNLEINCLSGVIFSIIL